MPPTTTTTTRLNGWTTATTTIHKVDNDDDSNRHVTNTRAWIRPNKVYGLVHIAKTAGTTINGEMAAHFERCCGNKGYSHDYHAYSERAKIMSAQHVNEKKISRRYHSFQGQYKIEEMDEIGYTDCDWITHENSVSDWIKIVETSLHPVGLELELHVPCREPLSHLMSMFNFFGKTFDCNSTDLKEHIQKSIKSYMVIDRFDFTLATHPNITTKCFDPVPPTRYRDYMGTILQHKQVDTEYMFRATNQIRDKATECIWQQTPEFQDHVRDLVREIYDLHDFCNTCMGTSNELPLQDFTKETTKHRLN
jgi:hypothetical protein